MRKNIGFDFVPRTPQLAHLKWRNETGPLSLEVRVKEINEGANWYEKIRGGSKKIYLKKPLIAIFLILIEHLEDQALLR